jgi:hypothetical protein
LLLEIADRKGGRACLEKPASYEGEAVVGCVAVREAEGRQGQGTRTERQKETFGEVSFSKSREREPEEKLVLVGKR